RHAELGEGRTFEGAAGNAEQAQRLVDIGNGLGAQRVVDNQQSGELGDLRQRVAYKGGIGGRLAALHPGRAQRARRERRHALERGRKLQRLQDGRGEPASHTHTLAESSSRTIWLITLPSARPLNCGITWPMTFPKSLAPAAIAARTAVRISSGGTCAGRYASSSATSRCSASARSCRPTFVNCSAASRRFLMPRRTTSTASSSVSGWCTSNSRFLRSARIVENRSVRC